MLCHLAALTAAFNSFQWICRPCLRVSGRGGSSLMDPSFLNVADSDKSIEMIDCWSMGKMAPVDVCSWAAERHSSSAYPSHVSILILTKPVPISSKVWREPVPNQWTVFFFILNNYNNYYYYHSKATSCLRWSCYSVVNKQLASRAR